MRGRLQIDLNALASNYRAYEKLSCGRSIGAVVKADAYGLGAERVCEVLQGEGCGVFFVAIAEEGEVLRRLFPDAQILVFEGAVPGSMEMLLEANLIPVINSYAQFKRWKEVSSRPVALHVDTGIGRLGFGTDIVRRDFDGIDIKLLMTHLACADEPDHPMNRLQLDEFTAVSDGFPGIATSIGNSAGILLGEHYVGDLGRPGIGLYGNVHLTDSDIVLHEVATLQGIILQVRDYGSGVSLGYGSSYTTDKPMKVATVGIGYADGVPRSLSNKGVMKVDGIRCPIVGSVSMDLTLIDVTGVEVSPGDWAELFGKSIHLVEVAKQANMISYEILTGVGQRIERVYL